MNMFCGAVMFLFFPWFLGVVAVRIFVGVVLVVFGGFVFGVRWCVVVGGFDACDLCGDGEDLFELLVRFEVFEVGDHVKDIVRDGVIGVKVFVVLWSDGEGRVSVFVCVCFVVKVVRELLF